MPLGVSFPLLAAAAPPVVQDGGLISALDGSSGASPEARAVAVSIALGQMTGLALSPVLVLGLFGAWDWLRLDGDALPLHAQPWLWAPLLVLSVLVTLARTGSLTVPGAKYLVDVPQQVHSKITGLIAVGVFLPSVVASLEAVGLSGGGEEVARAGLGAWSIGLLLLGAFGSVWIVSNTVDALRFLCPLASIDAVMTLARGAVLWLVLGVVAIDSLVGIPVLTFLVCLPIVLACGLVAGACVRLNLFALVCAWDMLTRRWRRTDASGGPLRAFVASRGLGPAVRTMGTLEPALGGATFRWRPWFVMPEQSREVALRGPALTRGVIWSIVETERDPDRAARFALPPRYRGHEPVVARRLAAQVRDGAILRGIKGTVDFVRGMFAGADLAGFSGAAAPAASGASPSRQV